MSMTADEIYDKLIAELETYRSADWNHLESLCPGEFKDGPRCLFVPPPSGNVMVWSGLSEAADQAIQRFLAGRGHFKTSTSTMSVLSYLVVGRPSLPIAKSLKRKYKQLHWVPSFLHLDGRCSCKK